MCGNGHLRAEESQQPTGQPNLSPRGPSDGAAPQSGADAPLTPTELLLKVFRRSPGASTRELRLDLIGVPQARPGQDLVSVSTSITVLYRVMFLHLQLNSHCCIDHRPSVGTLGNTGTQGITSCQPSAPQYLVHGTVSCISTSSFKFCFRFHGVLKGNLGDTGSERPEVGGDQCLCSVRLPVRHSGAGLLFPAQEDRPHLEWWR